MGTFENVPSKPVPSLLRGFSAPVRLKIDRSFDELAFLAGNDDDSFNRWDASQQLATRVILELAAQLSTASSEQEKEPALPQLFIEAFRSTLMASELDPSLKAYAITLPDYATLSQEMTTVDPDALCGALRIARRQLVEQTEAELLDVYTQLTPVDNAPFDIGPESVGRRRLRNVCLSYLSKLPGEASEARCVQHFHKATCMTDAVAAASALASLPGSAREEVLGIFYERAKKNKEALVINKWFAMQASADAPDALQTVEDLMKHEAFDANNPNRLRSLVQTFASANPRAFHAADGSGYSLIGDQVLEIDKKNPQVAARLCGAFGQWRCYEPDRQQLMEEQLLRIKGAAHVSKDTYEIASRSLA